MAHVNKRPSTDPVQLASLGSWILNVSKVSEPALTSDVPIVHALAGAHYQLSFLCSFARTVTAHDTQNLRHWVFCASVPSNYRWMSVECPILLQVAGRGSLVCHIPTPRQQDKTRQKRTLKFTFVISSNPSSKVGSRYREAKPVNAILGNMVLDSGFICRCKSVMESSLYAGQHSIARF